MNETALILEAKQGNVEAFNELVLVYQDIAFSVAFRIFHDQQSAADATQNAFISAFRKLHQFRGDNFKAWLLRIVTNACYDELRRRRRHPTASIEGITEDFDGDELPVAADDNFHMVASVESPESAAQRGELRAAIEECIRRLNETYRIIALLVDVEGLSYEEAAAAADISLGTVKSRLSRARARLRDCLNEYQELLPGQYRLENK